MMNDKIQGDFPIDWVEDDYISRREFFKFVTLSSGGLAIGSLALAGWASLPRKERSFEPLRIASAANISVGGSIDFAYPRTVDPCILLQPEAGIFVAYSRRCTHLSCPVEYQPEKGRLYCPCHNGAFNPKDGHVLQGPPPRRLVQITLKQHGADIFAVGVKEV